MGVERYTYTSWEQAGLLPVAISNWKLQLLIDSHTRPLLKFWDINQWGLVWHLNFFGLQPTRTWNSAHTPIATLQELFQPSSLIRFYVDDQSTAKTLITIKWTITNDALDGLQFPYSWEWNVITCGIWNLNRKRCTKPSTYCNKNRMWKNMCISFLTWQGTVWKLRQSRRMNLCNWGAVCSTLQWERFFQCQMGTKKNNYKKTVNFLLSRVFYNMVL